MDRSSRKTCADTLEHLDDFYDSRRRGSAPTVRRWNDFRDHTAEWVDPVSTEWRGLEVCEMPPNSRGHLALRALERLEPLDGLTPDDAEWHQRLIRSFDDQDGRDGDTIYLCARDENGMSVSLNQSLSAAFGSGVVIPGTGVLLHNRARVLHAGRVHRRREADAHARSGDGAAGRRAAPHLRDDGRAGADPDPPAAAGAHLRRRRRTSPTPSRRRAGASAPSGLLAEAGLPDIGAQPMPIPDNAGHAHAILVSPRTACTPPPTPARTAIALGY